MATDSCRDFSGFPHDMRKNAEQCDEDIIKRKGEGETGLRLPGQGCSKLIEPLPTFDKMECEVVYPSDNGSDNNAYMVFGRDRHTRKALAGYGGYGCTSAGMIDLVVGRGGAAPKHQEIVGPNFFTDAARVYISQRADIDRYFNLPVDIAVGIKPSENRSAVGIKADAVRIIGREGIRLVTNARTGESNPKEFNSRLEPIQSDGPDRGIHLIAHRKMGKYDVINPHIPPRSGDPLMFKLDKLQPLVRGDNLMLCINELVELTREMNFLIRNFITTQTEYNTRLAFHTHTTNTGVAFPDPGNMSGWAKATIETIKNAQVNLSILDTKMGVWYKNVYLSSASPLSFLSRYNKTN